MKKISAFITTCFLLICLVPSLGILFFGESKAAANEILASKPVLIQDGKFNTSVLNEFEDYFESRFALRQELSTIWAKVNAVLFHSSAEDQVLLGKDGWLFYADTVDDYMGDVLSEEQAEAIALRLAALRDACEAKGAKFLFVIAPNKNSLYSQYMPFSSLTEERTDLQRLYRKLDELDVPYADLHAAFQGCSEILYYRTDSHWNNKGAALAADTILAEFGRSPNFFSAEFTEGYAHKGDLYEMLYPAGTETEEGFCYAPGFQFQLLNNDNNGNAITIRTENESASGRLYCWRDSFGASLYPFLAENFHEATFSRSSSYDAEKLEDGNYDYVILEIVERNLINILE